MKFDGSHSEFLIFDKISFFKGFNFGNYVVDLIPITFSEFLGSKAKYNGLVQGPATGGSTKY